MSDQIDTAFGHKIDGGRLNVSTGIVVLEEQTSGSTMGAVLAPFLEDLGQAVFDMPNGNLGQSVVDMPIGVDCLLVLEN